jgi:hypothetical protein
MRLRRVRFKLQWLVVAIAIAAILTCAAVEVAPDAGRRWRACKRMADLYAAEANWWSAQKPRAGWSPEGWNREHDYITKSRNYCEEKSGRYRRALFVRWEFYSLGASLPPW